MRIAYADPPYPGMSGFYKNHPDYGGEVDHEELVGRLIDQFDSGRLRMGAGERLTEKEGFEPSFDASSLIQTPGFEPTTSAPGEGA